MLKEEKKLVEQAGGDFVVVKWPDSNNIILHTLKRLSTDEYALLELSNESYCTTYEQVGQERQTKKEILDYLEHLNETEEAKVKYIHPSGNEMEILNKFSALPKVIDKILLRFKIHKLIENLTFRSGDFVNVYNQEGRITSKQRLKKLRNGMFLLLSTEHKVITTLEEEQMTASEIRESLFALVIEEHRVLEWHHTFSEEEKITIISEKMISENVQHSV